MGNDKTENARREAVRELNTQPKGRAELELQHGQVWDTDELQRDFEVQGFLARLWRCEGEVTECEEACSSSTCRAFTSGSSPTE